MVAGTKDGGEWAREQDAATLRASLKPGQLGADEGLINAMGAEHVARRFGVPEGTPAFSKACQTYNRAFDIAVAAQLKAVES
jgi:hypothetical protein